MDKEIVYTAIENLKTIAKINALWLEGEDLDGRIKLTINNVEYMFNALVKKELRQYQVNQIIENKKSNGKIIIIANQIFPKIKEQLREFEIPYIEVNGNIFLKKTECFFFIDTNKKHSVKKDKANRAFTKTGVKVVFHLLNNPALINKKQREIAQETGVALGNIPQVISGLKETKYLLSLNKSTYVWENKKELLDRWVNEYAVELRPKILIGKYTSRIDWQEIPLDKNSTVWGGEPAADKLTNYLRPEKFILYTKESKLNLMKNYKLVPKENGEIEVLELFWNNKESEAIAPPILIYAELMLTGGKRNVETANMIYSEYIEPKL